MTAHEGRYWLTVAPHPRDPARVLAIVTDAHPDDRLHNLDVVVLDVEDFDTDDQALKWFRKVVEEKPWLSS